MLAGESADELRAKGQVVGTAQQIPAQLRELEAAGVDRPEEHAREGGHGKRRNLLSDYTFAVRRSAEDGELLNIGKAYSGLTDAELTEMTDWFVRHTIREFAHGRVRLVEPKTVIEVTFDRIQESKRHKSGYALRFPRILRLRPDKEASEIDTLETVRKLVEANTT